MIPPSAAAITTAVAQKTEDCSVVRLIAPIMIPNPVAANAAASAAATMAAYWVPTSSDAVPRRGSTCAPTTSRKRNWSRQTPMYTITFAARIVAGETGSVRRRTSVPPSRSRMIPPRAVSRS